MKFSTVKYSVKNQIATVELNRAEKHNAIDMETFIALDQIVKVIKKDKQIRVVIVCGSGEDFCSGIDVKSVFNHPKHAGRLLFKLFPWQSNLAQRVSTTWRSLNVPVIFAIQGRCWGAGLQIALGGDFRIASTTSSISIMEARWGLIPDMGGTLALRELLKLDMAKELAMTAKVLTSEEALNLGLITRISVDPKEDAMQMAFEIIQQSPDAIAACKKLYNRSWWGSKGMALAKESYYQIKILLGENYKIKGFNQTHPINEHKAFKSRKNW